MATMSIGAAIHWQAQQAPDALCITHEGRSITRAQLDRRSNRLARAYEQCGVKQDDMVTIALPNGIEFYEACIATWKLGATPQPVSARLPVREREAIVELADPPLVVGVEEGTHAGRTTVPAGFEPEAGLSEEPLPDPETWRSAHVRKSNCRSQMVPQP